MHASTCSDLCTPSIHAHSQAHTSWPAHRDLCMCVNAARVAIQIVDGGLHSGVTYPEGWGHLLNSRNDTVMPRVHELGTGSSVRCLRTCVGV